MPHDAGKGNLPIHDAPSPGLPDFGPTDQPVPCSSRFFHIPKPQHRFDFFSIVLLTPVSLPAARGPFSPWGLVIVSNLQTTYPAIPAPKANLTETTPPQRNSLVPCVSFAPPELTSRPGTVNHQAFCRGRNLVPQLEISTSSSSQFPRCRACLPMCTSRSTPACAPSSASYGPRTPPPRK